MDLDITIMRRFHSKVKPSKLFIFTMGKKHTDLENVY